MVHAAIMLRAKYRAILLVTVALGAGVACTGERERYERDLQALRAEIAELRRARTDQQSRLSQLQEGVRALRDDVETMRYAARRPEQVPDLPVVSMAPETRLPVPAPAPPPPASVPRIRVGPSPPPGGTPPQTLPPDALARIDHKGIETEERLEVAAVPPVPKRQPRRRAAKKAAKKTAKTQPAPPPSNGKHVQKRYRQAHRMLKSGDVDEARRRFTDFVSEFPAHELADNAQYWVGECHYSQREYETAVRSFRRVLETYPTGNKVPDALLKIGLAYLSLGDRPSAREVLAKVVELFPESNAARIAIERSKVL